MRVLHRIKAHPQMVMENGADALHVVFVHGAGEVPEILSFDFEDHRFKAELAMTYGAGKESTWLTPDGPRRGVVTYGMCGISQAWVTWPPEILGLTQFGGLTPIDEHYGDYYNSFTVRRRPGDPEDCPSPEACEDHLPSIQGDRGRLFHLGKHESSPESPISRRKKPSTTPPSVAGRGSSIPTRGDLKEADDGSGYKHRRTAGGAGRRHAGPGVPLVRRRRGHVLRTAPAGPERRSRNESFRRASRRPGRHHHGESPRIRRVLARNHAPRRLGGAHQSRLPRSVPSSPARRQPSLHGPD